MSSRELVHIVSLSISRPVAMKARPIPRGNPPFHESNGIAWKAVNGWGRACTALNERPYHQGYAQCTQTSGPRGRLGWHRSKLVERLVSKNRERLFGVGYGQHHNRPFSFSRRSTVAALDIDATLGQKIRNFLQRTRFIFEAEKEGCFFSKFNFCRLECRPSAV